MKKLENDALKKVQIWIVEAHNSSFFTLFCYFSIKKSKNFWTQIKYQATIKPSSSSITNLKRFFILRFRDWLMSMIKVPN